MATDAERVAPGRLYYLMGGSGAGKDSLMSYARHALDDRAGVAFAHRYITRAADRGGENHVALSEREFELRARRGLFLFEWQGNGCRYGIGAEVCDWLARGLHVVVNGSRAYLPRARARMPALVPVLLRVSETRLAERLQARAREDAAEVSARLARAARYRRVDAPGLVVIDNDGELAEAGRALIALLLAEPEAGGGRQAERR